MNSQPVWKRFLTVAAGPAMNFVFAFAVCIVLLANYIPKDVLPKIGGVVEGTPAMEQGILPGDVIVSVNGSEISFDSDGTDLIRYLIQNADPEAPIDFVVDRNGENMSISIMPRLSEVQTQDPETGEIITSQTYQIGVQFDYGYYSFGEAVGEAAGYMVDCTRMMLNSIKNLIFKGEGIEDMSGPVGIISFVSEQVSEGMYMILYIVFIISLNLGLMNLLPIPALDGGRLIFLIVEAVRRKPIPPEKEGMVHMAGFILLLALIVFVTFSDVSKLF